MRQQIYLGDMRVSGSGCEGLELGLTTDRAKFEAETEQVVSSFALHSISSDTTHMTCTPYHHRIAQP